MIKSFMSKAGKLVAVHSTESAAMSYHTMIRASSLWSAVSCESEETAGRRMDKATAVTSLPLLQRGHANGVPMVIGDLGGTSGRHEFVSEVYLKISWSICTVRTEVVAFGNLATWYPVAQFILLVVHSCTIQRKQSCLTLVHTMGYMLRNSILHDMNMAFSSNDSKEMTPDDFENVRIWKVSLSMDGDWEAPKTMNYCIL